MTILLHEMVRRQACERARAPALSYKSESLDYDGLWELARCFGAGLLHLGLERGDRVAIYLEKRPEAVAAVIGTSAADGVFVPVNPLLRPGQVQHILGDCDVRVLVTSSKRLESLGPELAACNGLRDVIVVDPPPNATTPAARGPDDVDFEISTWDGVVGSPGSLPTPRSVDIDVAAIFYTSGSTGRPKGVVLTHRNLVVGAESVAGYLDNNADDVLLAVLPMSFDAGFSQLTTAFTAGAHVVLHNYTLPTDVVQLCARHGVTGLTCVPPLWIQLAEREWPREATAHMRYFANTGGRMPRATLDRLRRHFPAAQPFLMYGLTEAFRSTFLDPSEVDRRPDSIGKAIPNAEILVIGDDGRPCAPGEHGELVHRGALVALGYWNDPERTRQRFRPVASATDQGWRATPEVAVWSGDIVTTDDEGFLYFVGRNDEMIKTSGYRVSPSEIEEAVYDSGLVRDAVALGVPDETLGQRIVVVVAPQPGTPFDEQRLLDSLRQQLPLYMIPRTVLMRPELPRSPNGKFDRALMRAEIDG